MIPYLLVMGSIPTLFTVIPPSKRYSAKKICLFLVLGIAALLGAIRSVNVGVDTAQYYSAYVSIGDSSFMELGEYRYEVGFTVLCWLLNFISPNPQLLLVVTSFFILYAVGNFIDEFSENVAISVFLFFALNIYSMYLNVMRQAVAIAFILFMYSSLVKRRWARVIIFALCAVSFHKTALIAIWLSMLLISRFRKGMYFIYLGVTLLAFISANNLTALAADLLEKDEFYNAAHAGSNYFGALIQFIFIGFIATIVVFYVEWQKKNIEDLPLYKANMFEHALMISVVFAALGVQIEVLSRFTQYFFIFSIVAVPFALKFERRIVSYLFCAIALVYFVVIAVSRPEWYGVIPYEADLGNVVNMFLSIS